MRDWVFRRRFYRRKLADPFPSYLRYCFVSTVEFWGAVFFTGASLLGLLCIFAGVLDWITKLHEQYAG